MSRANFHAEPAGLRGFRESSGACQACQTRRANRPARDRRISGALVANALVFDCSVRLQNWDGLALQAMADTTGAVTRHGSGGGQGGQCGDESGGEQDAGGDGLAHGVLLEHGCLGEYRAGKGCDCLLNAQAVPGMVSQ